MTIHLSVPREDTALKPRITVIGVGGAGGNAVNNMISSKLEGVEFLCANTDAQSLLQSQASRKIQLGHNITHGLGAGSRPDVGRAAAEEAIDEIAEHLQSTNMVFVTAGMGGGTGTGAAPVIARLAREHGILTVGVVTKPFHFEGINRARIAEAGIQEMQQYVDTLIVIPNQNLFRVANEKTTFAEAFAMADQVLYSGVRGITDLMVVPGLINLDFADIRTVMSEMGKAMMGTGEADGEDRATRASEAAISNPLLDEVSMKGARGVLINITGGADMTLFEVDEAANRIGEEVDPEANIIFGSTLDPSIEGRIRVSVVATGIEAESVMQPRPILKVVPRVEPERREAEAPAAVETAAEPAAEAPAAEAAPAAPAEPAGTPDAAASGDDDAPEARPAIDVRAEAVPLRAPAEPRRERDASPEADDDGRPERERRPSLLQRMTSAGRARRGRDTDDVEPVLAPVVEPAAVLQPRPAPTPASSPVLPRLPEQSHFDEVRPAERAPTAGGEDDLLDIPAFLRRQAN